MTAATDDPEDLEAAEMFRVLTNWTFADPILRGRYPADWVADLLPVGPAQLAEDLALISAPLDLYGVNYYEPTCVEAPRPDKDYSGVLEVDVPEGMPFSPVPVEAAERTDFGWPVAPEGLTQILRDLDARYPDLPPVVVTESGASFHDVVDEDGRVADPRRIAYVDAHLRAVLDAVDSGVDVRGFYVWSAFDNFEWAAGYDERFGLVHVDLGTQVRTRKDSFAWYRAVIASQPGRQARAAGSAPTPDGAVARPVPSPGAATAG